MLAPWPGTLNDCVPIHCTAFFFLMVYFPFLRFFLFQRWALFSTIFGCPPLSQIMSYAPVYYDLFLFERQIPSISSFSPVPLGETWRALSPRYWCVLQGFPLFRMLPVVAVVFFCRYVTSFSTACSSFLCPCDGSTILCVLPTWVWF